MKIKLLKLVSILTLSAILVISILKLSVFFTNSSKLQKSTNTFFIIAEHNAADRINLLRKEIKPLIDRTMRDELNLPDTLPQPYFKTPPHTNLTLYYAYNWQANKASLLLNAVDALSKKDNLNAFEVTFEKPDFFGFRNDEIVIKITDPPSKHSLGYLNSLIKQSFNHLHTQYDKIYNKEKSEHFPYIPHIALGRIPSNNKKYFASEKGIKILDQIKQRIKNEIFPVITKSLTRSRNVIRVNAFYVYDVKKRKRIKSVPLT